MKSTKHLGYLSRKPAVAQTSTIELKTTFIIDMLERYSLAQRQAEWFGIK